MKNINFCTQCCFKTNYNVCIENRQCHVVIDIIVHTCIIVYNIIGGLWHISDSWVLRNDKWTYPHMCDFIISPKNGLIHMCDFIFHLQMDISTYPHGCDFIIPPTNEYIHMCMILSFHLHMDLSTCVWFYHSTYTWTYPHLCDCIIPPTNWHIHNTTCVLHSTYKWTYPHVCDFIIPPTNGYIHMCVILSFHLHMDISTCVWFYHSTINGHIHMCVIVSFHLQIDISTIPHVCDFIIPPTNGHIHNTTCVWFYHST